MSDLSTNKQRPVRLAHGNLATAKLPLDNLNETVYVGSIVFSDVNVQDGYFRALSTGVSAATADIFGGISIDKASITTGQTAGDVYVSVARNGVWGFAKGSVAQTDIGASAYASDDDTIVTASTNNLWVGIIEEVDDTYVWVNIEPAFLRTNSPT